MPAAKGSARTPLGPIRCDLLQVHPAQPVHDNILQPQVHLVVPPGPVYMNAATGQYFADVQGVHSFANWKTEIKSLRNLKIQNHLFEQLNPKPTSIALQACATNFSRALSLFLVSVCVSFRQRVPLRISPSYKSLHAGGVELSTNPTQKPISPPSKHRNIGKYFIRWANYGVLDSGQSACCPYLTWVRYGLSRKK